MKLLLLAVLLVLFLSFECNANTLTWQDNSSIEDGFIIEMLSLGTWTEVARVGPNVVTYTDAFTEGVYRVWAFLSVPSGGELRSATPSNVAGKLNGPINLVIK